MKHQVLSIQNVFTNQVHVFQPETASARTGPAQWNLAEMLPGQADHAVLYKEPLYALCSQDEAHFLCIASKAQNSGFVLKNTFVCEVLNAATQKLFPRNDADLCAVLAKETTPVEQYACLFSNAGFSEYVRSYFLRHLGKDTLNAFRDLYGKQPHGSPFAKYLDLMIKAKNRSFDEQ